MLTPLTNREVTTTLTETGPVENAHQSDDINQSQMERHSSDADDEAALHDEWCSAQDDDASVVAGIEQVPV